MPFTTGVTGLCVMHRNNIFLHISLDQSMRSRSRHTSQFNVKGLPHPLFSQSDQYMSNFPHHPHPLLFFFWGCKCKFRHFWNTEHPLVGVWIQEGLWWCCLFIPRGILMLPPIFQVPLPCTGGTDSFCFCLAVTTFTGQGSGTIYPHFWAAVGTKWVFWLPRLLKI